MSIHFTLPEGFSGTVTVDKTGKVTIIGDISTTGLAASAVSPTTSSGLTVAQQAAIDAWPMLSPLIAVFIEDLVTRQATSTPGSRSREVSKVLIDRGWHGNPDKAGRYMRWVYPGKQRKVTLYMSGIELNNIRVQDRDFMMSLPGHHARKNDVRLPFNGDAFDQAMENVETIEKWADG